MNPDFKEINMPETVGDAVTYIIARLSEEYKQSLMNSEFENLLNYNRFLGMNIRNMLYLWRGNDALMKSCLNLRKIYDYDPDIVSLILIEEVWKELTRRSS